MQSAELQSVLSVNNAPFIKGMNDSVSKAKKSGKEIEGAFAGLTGSLKGVGASMVAAFSVGAVIQAGRQVLDFAGQLQDSADALGLNVTVLQGFAGAMATSGVSSEKFTKGLTKLTQNISEARNGSDQMMASFDKLGISFIDLANDDPSEILLKMADGMKNAKHPTEAFAAAMAILGKGAVGMIASLKQGREEFVKQADEVKKLSSDEAGRLDAIGDAFTNLGISAKVGAGKAISALAELFEMSDDKSIKGNDAGNRLIPAAYSILADKLGIESRNKDKITIERPTVHEVLRAKLASNAMKNANPSIPFKPQSKATANTLEDQARDAMEAMRGDAKNKEALGDAEADKSEKMQDASAANERDLDEKNSMARIANLRSEIEEGNKLYMEKEAEKLEMKSYLKEINQQISGIETESARNAMDSAMLIKDLAKERAFWISKAAKDEASMDINVRKMGAQARVNAANVQAKINNVETGMIGGYKDWGEGPVWTKRNIKSTPQGAFSMSGASDSSMLKDFSEQTRLNGFGSSNSLTGAHALTGGSILRGDGYGKVPDQAIHEEHNNAHHVVRAGDAARAKAALRKETTDDPVIDNTAALVELWGGKGRRK